MCVRCINRRVSGCAPGLVFFILLFSRRVASGSGVAVSRCIDRAVGSSCDYCYDISKVVVKSKTKYLQGVCDFWWVISFRKKYIVPLFLETFIVIGYDSS